MIKAQIKRWRGNPPNRGDIPPVPEAVIENGIYWVNIDDLPSFIDVRLGAQYRYNSQLDAVVRIDNLLNQRAEWWMGYPIQGIRANFGLLYKF